MGKAQLPAAARHFYTPALDAERARSAADSAPPSPLSARGNPRLPCPAFHEP